MLSEEQKEAVEFVDGPALVLAGPGSGKTTVITRRIQHLMSGGIPPEHILVITFTKSAAKEMRERFLKLDPNGGAVNFGTFHSIFYHILAREYNYRTEDILKESIKFKLLKEVLRKLEFRLNDLDGLESVFAAISMIKGGMYEMDSLSDEDYSRMGCFFLDKKDFVKVFEEYQKALDINHVLDFDDMVGKCYELFLNKQSVLQYYQNQFEYIMIDEFQDISPLQYKVVKLLSLPQNNLFIVGDDDQSIYGFRGSNPGIMLGFENDFTNVTTIHLSNNYRCNKEICERSVKLIRNNKSRFNKAQISFQNSNDGVFEKGLYEDEISEAKGVVKKIKLEVKRGIAYKDMAIIYRNHKQAEVLEGLLLDEKIPARCLKNHQMGDNEVIKDILSYISIAKGRGKRSDFLRVMNKPDRGILRQALDKEETSLGSIKKYYAWDEVVVEKINKWELLNGNLIKLSASGALSLIAYGFGYENYLKNTKINDFKAFERLVNESKNYKSIDSFCDYLKERLTNPGKPEACCENGVGLYTLHACKGLEFEVVFIIQANEGIIPQKRCVTPAMIEEERRLFYVGMTRAKLRLYISSTRFSAGKEMIPSRFLDEI